MLSSASPRLSHPATGGQRWTARALTLLRRHWLVSVLLAAGLVLRVATQLAYQPALVYIDTLKYLYGVYPGADPLGYRVLLKAILVVGDLGFVAAIQHLLGLAEAVALYTVLLRRGVWRWLAALAVAPVLLDAYQLQMEQMIMPDVWFEAMLVAGLVALLWRPAVTPGFAAAAGLVLGVSATFHQLGEVLIVPVVAFLLVAGLQGPGGGWRRALSTSAALAVAFLLPILGYSGVSYARTGHFWLSGQQSHSGRMAAAADCATLKLPSAVRPLCPSPAAQAQGPDWLEHSGKSPLHAAAIPAGTSRAKLIGELTSAVEHQQPVRVVAAIARDSVRLFAVTRDQTSGVGPIARWQFQASYPTYPPWVTVGRGHVIVAGLQWRVFGPFRPTPLRPSYGDTAHVIRPLATFLRSYQLHGGFTPGPLLLLLTLAGGRPGSLCWPSSTAGRRAAWPPPARAGQPAVHPDGGHGAAGAGCPAVLLAVPAPGRGHAPARGRAGDLRGREPLPGAAAVRRRAGDRDLGCGLVPGARGRVAGHGPQPGGEAGPEAPQAPASGTTPAAT